MFVLIKFTTYCAHRSGSNFLCKLIVDNFHNCDFIERQRGDKGWKHGMFHPTYMDKKDFCLIIARHPIKWVNSCLRFNADMWKWWNVNNYEGEGLSFEYKDRHVSIPKMISKWNDFYKEWIQSTDCSVVWYPDLLQDDSRERILTKIGQDNNLERKTKEIEVPEKVQHSKQFTEEKRINEANLEINNELDKRSPVMKKYIIDNIDYDVLSLIQERKI